MLYALIASISIEEDVGTDPDSLLTRLDLIGVVSGAGSS
jgi:hypothetical protein